MHTRHSSEKKLLDLFSKGDQFAFEKIYNQYSSRLFGYLRKLVKSEEHASELLQEVFIKIWNNRKTIDPDLSFRSYLFRIAENTVYDFFRKVSRERKLQEELIKINEEMYSHVEEAFFTKESQQFLQNVIDTLPPKRRQVFRLIKMEEYSYEEVSELLNISTSTISDHIVKANKFVEEKFKGYKNTSMSMIFLIFLS
ncbi:MAG: RNA polymerase sigma-70 factor [Ginsengibacter sp.]